MIKKRRVLNKKKKVVNHLKDDIKTFNHEAEEDKELIHDLNKKPKKVKTKKKRLKKFVEKRMNQFKLGDMHSRVKRKGPVVTNPKQAIAIALSEARKKGMKVSRKK
jgi:hypothetical protein